MRVHWRVLWVAIFLTPWHGYASQPDTWPDPKQVDFTAKVTRVFDGDTVVLQGANAETMKARIVGIDAPEVCQAFGRESAQALKQKILHATVSVRSFGRDTFGRELVVLWHQDQDVGADLVAQGLAWAYVWKGKPSVYITLEQHARRTKRGLFQDSKPESPRAFRKRHGPCFR
jgi:endonuclease YncB( thermonuclease family)